MQSVRSRPDTLMLLDFLEQRAGCCYSSEYRSYSQFQADFATGGACI